MKLAIEAGITTTALNLLLPKEKIDVYWKKWTRDSPKRRIEAWEEDALV